MDDAVAAPLMPHAQGAGGPQRNTAVTFSFEAVSYSVLLVSEMRMRRVLTDVCGVSAPVDGALCPGNLQDQLGSAPALMCILGPSGAGARNSLHTCKYRVLALICCCGSCGAWRSVPSQAIVHKRTCNTAACCK